MSSTTSINIDPYPPSSSPSPPASPSFVIKMIIIIIMIISSVDCGKKIAVHIFALYVPNSFSSQVGLLELIKKSEREKRNCTVRSREKNEIYCGTLAMEQNT